MADFSVARRVAADAAFEAYDFGEDIVGEINGWESDRGDDGVIRTFFIEDPDGGPCERCRFIVRFAAGGSRVTDAYVA